MARPTLLILLSLLTLLLLLTTPTTADEWQDYRQTCLRKKPSLVSAIDKFCSVGNIVTPSNYAEQGAGVGTSFVQVYPSEYCIKTGKVSRENPVWIPQVWCRRQMFETCAKGAPNGWGNRIYGGRGCQVFLTNPG